MYQITAFAYSILATLATIFKDEYEEKKPRAEEIVSDTEKSLKALAQKVLDKEIKIEDVPKHLEQEFLLVKTELLEGAASGVSFVEETANEWLERGRIIIDSLLKEKQ